MSYIAGGAGNSYYDKEIFVIIFFIFTMIFAITATKRAGKRNIPGNDKSL